MRYLLLLWALIAFASCNNSTDAPAKDVSVTKDSLPPQVSNEKETSYIHRFPDMVLEHKITAALLRLSFVQKSNSYIDSLSNHKQGISFMLDSAKDNLVSVQAGYNGEQRFETYYHFYVNPRTMEIQVYDPVEDKTRSVKEYLKTLK
ncbi:MAG TPA: hypothetical protein PLZ45_09420 [Ferruginibacter sp.]|nr:hypothetical protein [Chitinophagaceae bacterium]HRI24886.1 hypothetical protein [Ferruginibacter sp.]